MPYSRIIVSSIYLIFAIAGAVLPTLENISFIQDYGPYFRIDKFIELANDNSASRSLSKDLLVSAGAILFWMSLEVKRLQMKNFWVVLLGTFVIAFAFSAPLFLYLRERRLIELEREGLNLFGLDSLNLEK